MNQPAGERPVHWADAVADEVARRSGSPVISTGISPSGEIHIGNMREVLTADAVHRALRERGVASRLNFVADGYDPLRRVYPFLDETVYAPLVGCPLSEIPCPCGAHRSYAEHFLEPFLASLERLGVEVEVVRADELYASGRMTSQIVAALDRRDAIAAILAELTGKDVGEAWSPFAPRCPGCGRMTAARVTGHSAAEETVSFSCPCGAEGTVPMAGGGKLVWRIDWPARWKALGVTVEPFGKDHATAGGSYDTGVRIAREIFGIEPPYPIPYEWISLKGRGDMSSSKGNVLSIADALRVAPPDVLRYLVLREKPSRAIRFDPGLPLLQLIDQVDDPTASGRDERAIELSRAAGFAPVGVPYKHLVVVAQTAGYDVGRALEILARTGYPGAPRDAVAERIDYVRRWLASYAPEELRFEVRPELPEEVDRLDASQREFLGRLAEALEPGMDGATIHDLVYRLAGEQPGTPAKRLFEAVYVALLGKPRGPRAGTFIEVLGVEFCAARFRAASGG